MKMLSVGVLTLQIGNFQPTQQETQTMHSHYQLTIIKVVEIMLFGTLVPLQTHSLRTSQWVEFRKGPFIHGAFMIIRNGRICW